jgi:hypothetical protein
VELYTYFTTNLHSAVFNYAQDSRHITRMCCLQEKAVHLSWYRQCPKDVGSIPSKRTGIFSFSQCPDHVWSPTSSRIKSDRHSKPTPYLHTVNVYECVEICPQTCRLNGAYSSIVASIHLPFSLLHLTVCPDVYAFL